MIRQVTVAGLLVLAGCRQVSIAEARQLIERYNRVVSEAYRRGDVTLIDPVVGPREGKKLTGLIGVRLDMGYSLDADLLSLEISALEQTDTVLRVRTQERWRYRDRKIGTGEPVGEESFDSYEMEYELHRIDGQWMVDAIRFTSPPQIGRQTPEWAAAWDTLHRGEATTRPQPVSGESSSEVTEEKP